MSGFTPVFIHKNCSEQFLSAYFLFWEILNLTLTFAVCCNVWLTSIVGVAQYRAASLASMIPLSNIPNLFHNISPDSSAPRVKQNDKTCLKSPICIIFWYKRGLEQVISLLFSHHIRTVIKQLFLLKRLLESLDPSLPRASNRWRSRDKSFASRLRFTMCVFNVGR